MALKHIIVGMLLGMGFIFIEMNATSFHQLLRMRSRDLANKIESINNFPLIGKLTNALPVAALVTCLKECPGQTAMVAAGLLVYMFYSYDRIGSVVRKYNPFVSKKKSMVSNKRQFDDSLFIFEGDHEDDLLEEFVEENLEEEIIEEEMFDEELVDEYYEIVRTEAPAQPRVIKFL